MVARLSTQRPRTRTLEAAVRKHVHGKRIRTGDYQHQARRRQEPGQSPGPTTAIASQYEHSPTPSGAAGAENSHTITRGARDPLMESSPSQPGQHSTNA